ncbi:MAG: chromosomal replication initiator protein DnaA [Clostridia bacterium]|nr:chromosomal replication initiator protein DnaA [Clostridia bacterium]
MDLESLWNSACSLLEQRMNYLAYSTWIKDNMLPVAMEGDTVILSAKMEPMIPMIQNKYLSVIEKSLTETEGKPLKALILGKEEAEHRRDHSNLSKKDDNDPHFNPKYTFDRFIRGDSNRFAYAAAFAAAETPGEAYNPLFIYGGVGLGKTHLMQAIGNYIHMQDPGKRILYMTSESFTNEMIDAIQMKKTYEFRAKLRRADVLMVDDIQFIAGREATQQEFFNTFNELYNDNKQIVLTSDKPPKDIQRLEERLCSRFEWGLVADIQAPDEETRTAILNAKIDQDHLQVPEEVVREIAKKVDSNVRELEGCLTRLTAYSNMTGQPITLELSERALKEIFDQRQNKIVTAELIMETVSDYYGVSISELIGPTRKREITVPRQVAIYLTREMTGMSLPQIGEQFGGRDHTTIMHSCKVMEKSVKTDSGMKDLVDQVKRRVQKTR